MSFLLPIALVLGLAAIFPVLAHALKRGQARPIPFPAARLVPEKTSSARQRHRLDDKFLLLLRVFLLLCLALLAATPFVQCSRLSLSRTNGASVSAALVIDDSASMRATTSEGISRLEQALRGADQLLSTARAGDSFSIVLAGYPARILTPATTELGSVREALSTITPSDRRTDLATALSLARGLQADLPQKDRPIVLLSDLASEETPDLTDVILPDSRLREPLQNCALVDAIRTIDAVQVEVACTGGKSLEGRKIELRDAAGKILGKPIPAKDGAVRLEIPQEKKNSKNKLDELEVRMTAPGQATHDQILDDDRCFVLDGATALTVGLRADQGKAGMKTGASTVVQAGIEALERGVRVQTLSLLPDQAEELEAFSALFIDDPIGFTPEVRDALSTWVKAGGVGVAFLGPEVARTPLGSDFSPFLSSAPAWSKTKSAGADKEKPGTLGPLTPTWSDIAAQSRATLASDPGVEVRASWDDGAPFVIERTLGRGLLISVSLPASVDVSDLALRPAFLELLDHAVSESAVRRGAQATPVGEPWVIASDATVRAPDGRILDKQQRLSQATKAGEQASPETVFVDPPIAGRYTIEVASEKTASRRAVRMATRDLREHVGQPNEALTTRGNQKRAAALTKVGISREIALLALLLGVLELAFRALRRARAQGPLPKPIS